MGFLNKVFRDIASVDVVRANLFMGYWPLILALFFGIISIFAAANVSTAESKATQRQKELKVANLSGSQWRYKDVKNLMGDYTIGTAQVFSSNTVNFDFPYSGEQRATLILRTPKPHPENIYYHDIMFSIEKGQILCGGDPKCKVLVKFDDNPATDYPGRGSNDLGSKTIFLGYGNHFMEKMLNAKRVLIQVTIFQEGSQLFEFDVSGFDQDKYMPKK